MSNISFVRSVPNGDIKFRKNDFSIRIFENLFGSWRVDLNVSEAIKVYNSLIKFINNDGYFVSFGSKGEIKSCSITRTKYSKIELFVEYGQNGKINSSIDEMSLRELYKIANEFKHSIENIKKCIFNRMLEQNIF